MSPTSITRPRCQNDLGRCTYPMSQKKAGKTLKQLQAAQKRVHWELMLLQQIRVVKLPEPTREYIFHPSRKWRMDFAWPSIKVCCEVEGITFFGKHADGRIKLGRHQTKEGFSEDCIKYAEAALHGWLILRFTPDQVKAGVAIKYLEQIIVPKWNRRQQLDQLL